MYKKHKKRGRTDPGQTLIKANEPMAKVNQGENSFKLADLQLFPKKKASLYQLMCYLLFMHVCPLYLSSVLSAKLFSAIYCP